MYYYIYLIFLFDMVFSSKNEICFRSGLINHQNINSYKNCAYLEGEIYISNNSFIAMQPQALNALKSIKNIKGNIMIDAYHPHLSDLSFLQNLKIIDGLSQSKYCIWIKNTSLKSLELQSLTEVHCKIFIYDNKDLCHLLGDTGYIDRNYAYTSLIRNNKIASDCQCNEQCSERGCWGRGPDQCITCRNHRQNSTCVQDCSSIFSDPQVGKCFDCSSFKASNNGRNCVPVCPKNYFLMNGTCTLCDDQCKDGCHGLAPHECQTCKNVKDGQYCVPSCPEGKFNETDLCEECHDQCKGGCSGFGPNKCATCKNVKDGQYCVNSCTDGKFNSDGECRYCHEKCKAGCSGPAVGDCNVIKHNVEIEIICSDGQYKLNQGCHPCHDQCKGGCSGSGSNNCTDCQHVKDGQYCVQSCPEGKFNANNICKDCHAQCKGGCSGWGPIKCTTCQHVKDGQYCVPSCSEGKFKANELCENCHDQCKGGCSGSGPNKCIYCKHVQEGEVCISFCPKDKYNHNGFCMACHRDCSDGCTGPGSDYSVGGCNGSQEQTSLIFIIPASITFIVVLILSLLYRYYKRRKNIHPEGYETEMSLIPSPTSDIYNPISCKFTTIKKSDVTLKKMLGLGAFGTVFEGIWTSEGGNNKIPVAVKVLHKNANISAPKEFLDEALIMASMDHPNVLHLLAICNTADIMLLTQLMPLGCLLNHVRKNKGNIPPKSLLSWSTQIAKGMSYLEQRLVVHRDLAARNVLLETSDTIKISDFGLSQFVDQFQFNNNAADTKFPIKWLALECLEERLFTHKSDVWAFGVTVWELLTFGDKPFADIQSRNLAEQLKQGLRLHQPSNCGGQVYVVLLGCWLLQPEFRPSFAELASIFEEMSREPSRYLVSHANAEQFKNMSISGHAQEAVASVHRKSDELSTTSASTSYLTDSLHLHDEANIFNSILYQNENSTDVTSDDNNYDKIINPSFGKGLKRKYSNTKVSYGQGGYLITKGIRSLRP